MVRQTFLPFWRRERVPLLVALLHWLTSFATERLIFEVAPSAAPWNYCLCKVLLFAALYGFWHLLWAAFRRGGLSRRTLLYALPYLAVLLVWMLFVRPYELSGDELNLYERALRLDSFAYWFNYLSGFYWITTLMIVPHALGPVLIKLLLQALIVGYCVARQTDVSGKRTGLLLYLPFLLPFVLDSAVSAHRLPIYGPVYLFFAAKLYYDARQKRPLRLRDLFGLSLLVGVLAVWRSEGIYLVVLGAVALAVAYRLYDKKLLFKRLCVYTLALVLVFVPQLQAYASSEPSLGLRTKPLCGYLLCNMLRNGLTEEDLGDERADIEAYLPLDAVNECNRAYGDGNYSQANVMSYTLDVDYSVQERFCSAVKRVILKHPLIYLRAQWGAWRYLHTQYPLSTAESGSVWKSAVNLSYWMGIPSILVVLTCLYALIRRRGTVFWLSLCGVANWVLVFLLMPAAYAKYFYVDFLLGWFFLFVGLCALLERRHHATA